MVETERILRFARTRVEAAEREVLGMEQQLKEARKRLTNNTENVTMASLEEWDALVRRGIACQDLRRPKEKLHEAMHLKDEEEKNEAVRQHKIRKAV